MTLDPNEQPSHSILKFESMLKTDEVYFFDSEDFEEIIHHYLNNGKIALAKKAIRMGLEQHPDSLELQLLQVEVLVFENKLDRAERILDQLQLLDSRNEEIFIQRANICSKKDNHRGAIELLRQALELSENDFEVYSLLGMEYLFLDEYGKAQSCFMKCLEADPEDYASLYNVVYCFEFQEDYEGAIRYLNNYLESSPYCQVAWHQLGKQYDAIDLLEESLAAFDFAIISDDSFLGAYFEKGKVLEKLGRYQEAIENYLVTTRMDDPTSHAYLRIGRCHEKLGMEEQARDYYYLTVHEDPLLDKGWLAITDYYFRKKNYTKAREYINKAINIDGENAAYWTRCGRIHQALGELDQADFAYKQAVDLGNYELGTWLQWARVLLANQEVAAAAEVLKQGAEFHPEAAELKYLMAGVCRILGKDRMACIHLRTAMEQAPGKLRQFRKQYPDLYGASWAQRIIGECRKASK
ncbi:MULTISPECIES: tetratricopeptide repeat protein [Robiginitalea]|uniref:tetratricopeptide repeat protein n=1 Tax=Robiginitalea TaxID=252306 RepID=UPI0023495A34|nr:MULTISPECIES: tetratricopeptide repeat protein [unclassified Robiginitalea]MDC6354786.1 tetratricopeptide repeat protein [Robiginitalea sp. PM2]MDC6375052.1 tetratricopeptide repeat protein [Robiginitalea sp. SP8]